MIPSKKMCNALWKHWVTRTLWQQICHLIRGRWRRLFVTKAFLVFLFLFCIFFMISVASILPEFEKLKPVGESLNPDWDDDEMLDFNDTNSKQYLFSQSILEKLKASWLKGRTLDKEFFDDQYLAIGRQVRRLVRLSEEDRRNKLQDLSRAIRRRIAEIQNPVDCDSVKLLVYNIRSRRCGFGCNTHDTLLYFFQSIYANRTFVLQSKGWEFEQKGWDHFLLPFSKCEYEGETKSLPRLSDATEDQRVVTSERDEFIKFDWTVPKNVLRILKKIHPDPYAWWVGQFVSYALRFQPWFEEELEAMARNIDFTKSVAGIHVRWGDKTGLFTREAKKHGVEEYMDFVEIWFRRMESEGHQAERVVYIATQDSKVWKALKSRYPHYKFIGSGYADDKKNMESTIIGNYANVKFALRTTLIDLYFLSKSNYVVCTASSNICRTVYELIMNEKVDPTDRLQSLDLFYYFRETPKFEAVQGHRQGNVRRGDKLYPLVDPYNPSVDGHFRGNKANETIIKIPANKVKALVQTNNITVFEDIS